MLVILFCLLILIDLIIVLVMIFKFLVVFVIGSNDVVVWKVVLIE